MGAEPKIMGKPPKSSILIGFSIIFTIHFGGFPPIFGNIHIPIKDNLGRRCLDFLLGQGHFGRIAKVILANNTQEHELKSSVQKFKV